MLRSLYSHVMTSDILVIDGIPVKLLPGKRRSIRLFWDRREQMIHCLFPWRVSEDRLRGFLEKRKKRVRALFTQAFIPEDGAPLLYRGVTYSLLFSDGKEDGDFIRDDSAGTITAPFPRDAALFFSCWKAYLNREAPRCFEERIAFYEEMTGCRAVRWRFRAMCSRWGSASPRGAMTLNTLLVMAPSPVADYVILHELAHMNVPDHSVRFWNEVEQHMPDYRLRRRWLRDNGVRLLSLY